MIRADKIAVNGKEYEASYCGEQDMSWSDDCAKLEIWRLENAYDDFKNKQKTGIVKPYNNYPMNIDTGQVFVMDLHSRKDGSVERIYQISDGSVWQDMPVTCQIWVEPAKS